METESFWAGPFGNEYTERNKVEWQTREEFWRSAIEYMAPVTVLEVGCNRGHNLIAMQSIDSSLEVCGVDINAGAVNEARAQGVSAEVAKASSIANIFGRGSKDLVFTAGVLIHIPPEDLGKTMRAIVDTSAKFVLAVEYAADEEEEVEYRGHKGKLWKRPFGRLYQEMGLVLLSTGVAGGFDQCTYWLLDKDGGRVHLDGPTYDANPQTFNRPNVPTKAQE